MPYTVVLKFTAECAYMLNQMSKFLTTIFSDLLWHGSHPDYCDSISLKEEEASSSSSSEDLPTFSLTEWNTQMFPVSLTQWSWLEVLQINKNNPCNYCYITIVSVFSYILHVIIDTGKTQKTDLSVGVWQVTATPVQERTEVQGNQMPTGMFCCCML